MSRRSVGLLLLLAIATFARAENWPAWRGPRGDGTSAETKVPIAWDGPTGKNVAWKTAIPGVGHSSPIVWNDRLFLTTCLIDSTERVLLCLDTDKGQILWQQTVVQGELESIHAQNSHASGTPATDGEFVYVAFMRTDGNYVTAPNVGSDRQIATGEMVAAAYDFSGNLQWMETPGTFISAHGFCTCPVLYRDMVILNGDHDGDSYIVALDQKTGKERWRRPRVHGTRSYATPLIREVDGRQQMVLAGSKRVESIDPNTGDLIWNIEGPTEQFVASMVFDGKRFYMNCGFPDHYVLGIEPDGHGDVTDTKVAWKSAQAKAYVPSPVVVDGLLFVADDRGTANCFDAATGNRHWQARMGNGFNASLSYANGFVYFVADNGKTLVVRPDKKLDVVATNELGEFVSASPAFSAGRIYLRGDKSLYCIESAE